jgi:hypothetical protein
MVFGATENSIGYALGLGALLIFASITLWVLAGQAATGRLGPNRFVGIRTRSIMASDQTWLVAHQAAQRALQVAAITLGITGALVAILGRNNDLLILILIVGMAIMLGALAKAVIFATQAANTPDGAT